MKYASFLLAGLSLITIVISFALFAGTIALTLQCLAAGLLIAAVLFALRRPRGKKPVPSSFAASFSSEIEPS